ncbi:hypothetical protein C8T65DRAFT_833811 [Cerioporus squamosus]|nr:hypothetical protein C8T65DRAFT_833811 [Cerioporus squamosus]
MNLSSPLLSYQALDSLDNTANTNVDEDVHVQVSNIQSNIREKYLPFVVYTDAGIGSGDALPPLDQIQGFNVVNLAFLLSDGPHDQVQVWANLDSQARQGLKAQYNDAGVSIVVSAFGQTELPTNAGLDPAALANQMAQFRSPGPATKDCNTLVNSAGGSAIFEIVKSGVDIGKLDIGKPGASTDADSGFIDPETLGTCIQQAIQQGWNAA